MNFLNQTGRSFLGSTFAGATTLAAPRLVSFAVSKMLAGKIGSIAASAIAVPLTGAIAPFAISLGFSFGERVWDEAPGMARSCCHQIRQAYRKRTFHNIPPPTTSSTRNGREVTRLLAPRFKAESNAETPLNCWDFVDLL